MGESTSLNCSGKYIKFIKYVYLLYRIILITSMKNIQKEHKNINILKMSKNK